MYISAEFGGRNVVVAIVAVTHVANESSALVPENEDETCNTGGDRELDALDPPYSVHCRDVR